MKKQFEYWYLEENLIGDFDNSEPKTLEAFGPFFSMKKLKSHLREQCSYYFKVAEHENLEQHNYEDFFSRYMILKKVKKIQPVPVVKISSKLKTLK